MLEKDAVTVILPRTGAAAPGTRSRLRRCVLAAALVFGLTAAGSVTASPARAEPTAAPDDGSVELLLSIGSHGVAAAEAGATTSLTVANGTDDELTGGRITLQLNTTPLRDADALDAWLDEGTATGGFEPVGNGTTPPLAADDDDTSTIAVPSDALDALAPGVYPLRATFTGATTGDAEDDTLTAHNLVADTVLTISDGTRPAVAVLVPITAAPTDGTLLTADELAELTAPEGALTTQLDAIGGTAAVLAVDPAIPTAIRSLGNAAPTTATDWLLHLESLPNERFALQFGDADPAVQAHAELPALLSPEGLLAGLDADDFADVDGASPTPAPADGDPDEPAVPHEAQLTGLRDALPDLLWPAPDVTGDDLTRFDDYLGRPATTIVSSDRLVDGPVGARAQHDGHALLVVDAAASAAYSDAAHESDDRRRDAALTVAHARLALGASPAPLLIGLDRDDARSGDALADVLAALGAQTTPTSLATVRTQTPADVQLDDTTDTARTAGLQSLLDDEVALRAFAGILDEPDLLLGPERTRLLRVIGVGGTATFADDLTAQRARTAGLLDAVGIQKPSAIQLLTASAELPVWVRNDLPWPVTVTVHAQPSDARLDVQPMTTSYAQPQSNTRVKIPIEARVGSGSLRMDFFLTSPSGMMIGAPQTADVTVRAEWEGIGLGVLGALIALLLIFGVVRTVRRRRRERTGPANAAPHTPDAPAEQP